MIGYCEHSHDDNGNRLASALCAGLLLALVLFAAQVAAGLEGYAVVEGRWFPHQSLLPTQAAGDLSIILQPEIRHSGAGADLAFVPYLRLDSQDPSRTRLDLRELNTRFEAWGWDWTAGIGKVFWGVAESNHLVDIINQTDLADDIDGESKLGQPMIHAARYLDAGTLELFVLPGFRERTFPGPDGRLYLPIDADHPVYEAGNGLWHTDLAVRWSRSIGSWDLGLAWFHGTRRDPRLVPNPATGLATPYYDQIDQLGIDLQGTTGPWLWKLEAFYRDTPVDDYFALVAGFEYEINGIAETGSDLAVLAEYSYDGRENTLETPYENDLFLGLRLALNDQEDTRITAGIVTDLGHDSVMWRIEAGRRLTDRWRWDLTIQGFPRTEPGEPQYFYRDDGYAQLRLTRYF